jgi:hypothetical protein
MEMVKKVNFRAAECTQARGAQRFFFFSELNQHRSIQRECVAGPAVQLGCVR